MVSFRLYQGRDMQKQMFISFGAAVLFFINFTAQADGITFTNDPFAGSSALSTPGRQVVGNENFINFTTGRDVFSFDSSVFGLSGPVNLINGLESEIPSGGVNFVVLRSFDNDNNLSTPFNAGTAANLIANRVDTAGAGFFIYFNQGLDLPRLVFSTDLSSSDADLKVLARLLNFTGDDGRAALEDFSSANFVFTSAVPLPASAVLMLSALGFSGLNQFRWRSKANRTMQAHYA
ncbi:MAG: hypothetical protein CTY29_09910 [Methylobacter sp.]|nr:MAG: hypothetical protein CTY29_09910 [Methylobacter sp.]